MSLISCLRKNSRHIIFFLMLLAGCLIIIKCSANIEVGSPRIPARAYLYANEKPGSVYPVVGFILFTHRPDTSEIKRYKKVYDAFVNNFELTGEFGINEQKDLAVTYWLLEKHVSGSDNIKNYDYARSEKICSKYGLIGEKGPVLLAFNNVTNAVSQDSVLILKLSDFADDDFNKAFGIWKERIILEPRTWNDGFTWAKVEIAFGNLLNNYGAKIVAVIGKIFGVEW
jgi:hypothetical protein